MRYCAVDSGFRCLAPPQPGILPLPRTRGTPAPRLPPLFVSSLPACLPPSLPASLPPSLPACPPFPAACPHSLSFEGSGFFSCVSVFFNLDLSNFSISAMSGLSDMLAGGSAHTREEPVTPGEGSPAPPAPTPGSTPAHPTRGAPPPPEPKTPRTPKTRRLIPGVFKNNNDSNLRKC